MPDFVKFVLSPAGLRSASLPIAGSRAGGVGVLNGESEPDFGVVLRELGLLAAHAHGPFGLKLDVLSQHAAEALRPFAARGLAWLILDLASLAESAAAIAAIRGCGVKVLAEVRTPDAGASPLDGVDGLWLKGNESGGYVGENSAFILLQKWLGRTELPLYLRGGLTPHVAAACSAVGVAGGVLDSQLLLMDEVALAPALKTLLGNLSGSETVAVGDGERGEYFRLLVRPGLSAARTLVAQGEGLGFAELGALVGAAPIGWNDPASGVLPIGQDVCFAAPWRKEHHHVAAVLQAFDRAIETHLPAAVAARSISEAAPLAQSLKLRFPIVQGPMTRVSDSAEFAASVADAGGLPMIAFALLKGAPLERLLTDTKQRLGDRPWGIGLLGFAPQALLDEQLAKATAFGPSYAIIAGGRPDQAVKLEAAGVPTFLHVPSPNLIPMFLQEGARRFIFEGRECGGHIGPLSSFVLWSAMVDRLLAELAKNTVAGTDIELLFAGGIHDASSSAIVQVLIAPLVARGAKVGILMGSAYLFTQEIVGSGAVVAQFQQEVLDCERTVNLESGPGHASRCAYTPFAQDFFRTRSSHRDQGVAADESRAILDDLILGRLRIASKGSTRRGLNAELEQLSAEAQRAEGMYMLGQVATLRAEVTGIAQLHAEVTDGAGELLSARLAELGDPPVVLPSSAPVDIAIIGLATFLPKANTSQEYWENILEKIDGITEIPSHRWDWRLYFDADRNAKDKIYSKWGGFLDDMAFDPVKYGMPPKSIEAVDPMQLMALQVARDTLVDAGYHEKAFDRERASVILGASGGTGDVGSQYGLRSELPRFQGELPADVADRLPEWTEDSFAGILLNVIAGRIANRLNFGGVNFTTDAACASSLAAVYQGVSELIAGRSDLVLAGGVDTVQGPFGYLCFSKTQALSPRGRCATFDASGDGIVISEGIAMVALKRLADAERDGDKVYGVIKGVGGSSDGNAKGMTAPLPAGQLRAMRRAYSMAGFGPESVGLFEAHGTGTVAGDTAELESTTRLIRERSEAARMSVIGSVKTMIGHTKATAGIAGLVKAVLALHHRVLPPHRGVDNPNRILREADSPLYLVDEATPWLARDDVPRRAAVSAFGFGGTNFHIVLEEYAGEYRDWLRPAASRRWPAELLLWDGTDRNALLATLTTFERDLSALGGVALRDLAASVTLKRRGGGETLAIVAKTRDDLAVKLGAALAFLRGDAKLLPPGVHHGLRAHAGAKLAVLFPGQGSQYPGMGRELAVHFPVLADTLTSADALLRGAFAERFGAAVRLSHFVHPRGAYDAVEKETARLALTSTDVAQPAIGAVEAGQFRLMQGFGLRADMFAGHSYGEFVAQFASGAIDFDSLMTLSAARGRFIVDAAGADGADLGTMVAVNALRAQVEDAIADIDGVIIANHNAPRQSIVSGSRPAVKAALAKLAAAGIEATELPVAAAFHSSLVKPAQQALADLIDATPWQASAVPVYSNTTARAHVADVSRTKKLMAEHLVRPVEFVAEIDAMYKDGARVFVEIGPKSVLTRLTAKILEGQPHVAVAIDDGTGMAGLLGALGQLACAGIDLDLAPLFAGRDCRIGDPARPETLLRTAPLSKTAWLLNGSRARRATEPVQQIGITLEQVEANAAAAPASTTAPAVEAPLPIVSRALAAAPSPTPVNRPPPVSTTLWRKDRPMDDRRPVPATADLAVAAEYFQTMRQFLETQERVMGMFMGDTSAAMRPALRQRPVPLSLPRVAQAAELPTPVPVPVAAAPVAAAVVTAPVAPAAVPKPAPVVASQPVVAAAQAVAAAPVAKPATPASSAVTRDKMVDMLLGIVEEKTGYPRDMVGLDQNLESDLGIDSIKRIEVVGAMLQALPAAYREALHDSRNKLNTQPTLNGLLELLGSVSTGGAVTVPFDVAEAENQAAPSLPPRHVVVPVTEPVPAQAARLLAPGTFILSADAHGVAAALARRLGERGHAVELVPDALLADEDALLRWCTEPARSERPLAGVLHLAALGRMPLPADASTADWRRELLVNEKSLFLLLRAFTPRFADGAHVLAATSLGGLFGRGERAGAIDAPATLSLQGGAVGKLKSLREERPGLRVKAVDLDLAQPVDALAATLLAEIELDGGRQEVGYPAGVRTVFRTVAAPAGDDPARGAIRDSLVVFASGGARGITAEVLRELARPGNTLVLTGRVALPEREAPEHVALADADALRQHFIGRVRSGELKLTPAEVHRHVQTVLARREMRANIDDFRRRGAAVEYHTVDVLHEEQVAALIADLYARHGAIGGVVHGAGVIEDKLLADKSSESWSRVVETKVLGLLLLQKYLRPETLRFLSVFSSVAGRYGNSGQSDYALGNELMNRLSLQLQQRWGARVNVHSLCWGPWGATQNGAGMVTAETEAKFAQKGVALVTSPIGRQLFREELQRAAGSPVEIVCGQGPWERHENEVGAFRLVEATGEAPNAPIGPLLGDATTTARPTGDQVISLQLDGRHRYLQEHCIDGTPILPAAAALEMLAEAAQALWPGWKVVEVRDFKLMKGVELKADARALQITINPPPYGSSEGFEVNAALQTDLGNGRALTHYRCVIRLEQQLSTGMPGRVARHTDQQLSVAKAYGEWLFHGPRFQVIEAIDGLSAAGAAAQVRSTHPSAWLAHTATDSTGWLFDPALLDAAAQMAWLWARAFRDESALPARFGRVVRYRDVFPARMLMAYERVATTDASLVRANVYFYDEAGELVMLVEELDSVASAALNRLGGTARSADNVPV